jgi:hypothetical protein
VGLWKRQVVFAEPCLQPFLAGLLGKEAGHIVRGQLVCGGKVTG